MAWWLPRVKPSSDGSALEAPLPTSSIGDGLGGGRCLGPYADLAAVVSAYPTALPADYAPLRSGGFASWNGNSGAWEISPSIAPATVEG